MYKLNNENILKKLLKSYEGYYDIETCMNTDSYLVAKCKFHLHNKKYVLVKSATLWEADSNEYVYIFKVNELNQSIYEKCRDYAYNEGMKLIQPKSGHMCSYITSIFICDTYDNHSETLLKKCKINKSFKFSLHGWMDFHTVCICTDNGNIFGNKSALKTTKSIRKLLANNL